MKISQTTTLLTLLTLVSCGAAKQDKVSNDPRFPSPIIKNTVPLMDATHETRFSGLPLEGTIEVSTHLWSGDHWALNKGLINKRWATPEQLGLDTQSFTKDEILLFTPEDIARLSPSEKYDLLLGRYDYPLKTEVAAKANPVAVYWEGIGNGWAAASSNHSEPVPKTLMNPDGISIPFGSSDIKALLSYYYAYAKNLPYSTYLGIRCQSTSELARDADPCGDDLSPASFHIFLTNKIGLRKEIFMVDIDRYQEVWNHPVQSFKTEIMETLSPDRQAPSGTKQVLRMKTRMSYIDESVGNSWEPIKGTYRQVTSNRLYSYDLYIADSGDIIGGSWRSNDRPDFIWIMPPVQHFEGYFSKLSELIKQ